MSSFFRSLAVASKKVATRSSPQSSCRVEKVSSMEKPNAHFVLVPFTAPGHTIPMIDIAHLLAEHGVRISFITTPKNAVRIKHIVNRVEKSNLRIDFVEINFPSTKFGLPQGCESLENIPSKAHLRPFFEAVYSLSEPLRCFLESLDSRPLCLITDTFDGWTGPVARKFGIPRVVFHTQSCSYISACHFLEMHKVFDCISDDFESVIVPDFPVKLIVNKDQTPGLINFSGFEDIRKTLLEEESLADAVVINTFEELERPFIEKYERVIGKKVWTIGPSCLYNKDVDMKASRGIEDAIDILQVQKWLDERDIGSVFYVNFGSVAHTNSRQLIEIGSGLEASNKPFILVIKKTEMTVELKQWLCEGFEERTKDRGLILVGWAPQMVILSHPAVGGFMTHCGWNSALESICMGVPMITWPHFGDQFINENLIVDILDIGISLGVKTTNMGSLNVVVQRDDVRAAVAALMDDGEEASKRRGRVKDLGEKAKKAMEDGGWSYLNMKNMIQFYVERGSKK